MNEKLIGKYIVDKRERTKGDVGQIIRESEGIKNIKYYLIKWIRIAKVYKGVEEHEEDGYALYTYSRLKEEFDIVDSLSDVFAAVL